MELSLYKMHGSKNTFYLWDTTSLDGINIVEVTKWLCQSELNDGADGLLIVLPSESAHAKMRVINADGSEASMCGNGLRCVARYVCERDGLVQTIIETMKANLQVQKESPLFDDIDTYSVEISPISFELESLPMNYYNKHFIQNEVLSTFSKDILYTALSVPNPHLIGIVDRYYVENKSHQYLLSKFLNNKSSYTPDGINVSYAYPLSNSEIFVRTYERGVGFTNACGTAMTASALVAFKYGYVTENCITVYNPGGLVQCFVHENQGNYSMRLSGNATFVQQLTVDSRENYHEIIGCKNMDESIQYDESLHKLKKKLEDYLQIS